MLPDASDSVGDEDARTAFPLTRRGYDPVLVDQYVEDTQAELQRLAAETRQLNATVARLRREAAAAARGTSDPLDAWGVTIEELTSGARADIDRIRAGAQEDADRTVETARLTAEGILREAQDRADDLERTSTSRHEQARRAAGVEREAADRAVASARRQLGAFCDSVEALTAQW
jgi:cell division septum initiation protein DivIVA